MRQFRSRGRGRSSRRSWRFLDTSVITLLLRNPPRALLSHFVALLLKQETDESRSRPPASFNHTQSLPFSPTCRTNKVRRETRGPTAISRQVVAHDAQGAAPRSVPFPPARCMRTLPRKPMGVPGAPVTLGSRRRSARGESGHQFYKLWRSRRRIRRFFEDQK